MAVDAVDLVGRVAGSGSRIADRHPQATTPMLGVWMKKPESLNVIVVGRSADKMEVATAVLESHGFAATGAFSEEEARTAIEAHNSLFAVAAGRFLDAPAQNRLRTAAAEKGAALITASIGHDDPKVHFTAMVIRKLVEERVRRAGPSS